MSVTITMQGRQNKKSPEVTKKTLSGAELVMKSKKELDHVPHIGKGGIEDAQSVDAQGRQGVTDLGQTEENPRGRNAPIRRGHRTRLGPNLSNW